MLRGSAFFCTGCKVESHNVLPCSVKELVRKSEVFVREHKDCKEKK